MLLLKTKLNVPPVRSSHVRRLELVQRLDKLRDYKLALIVASAGYGKTALVSALDCTESIAGGVVFD